LPNSGLIEIVIPESAQAFGERCFAGSCINSKWVWWMILPALVEETSSTKKWVFLSKMTINKTTS
jgi:hypothetical protein